MINRKLDSIQIRPISLRHGEESISVNGRIAKEDNYKDLHLVFEKVDVNKIIPTMDNLSVGGLLNGHLFPCPTERKNIILRLTLALGILCLTNMI